jgi:coiled-coil domain-containing protein 12
MTARMGKLERKTNEAIATILRQRLREERGRAGEQVDLVAGIREAEAERDRAMASDEDSE